MAKANGTGDGISRIMFYPQPDFGGDPQLFMETNPTLKKTLKSLGSVVVQGNPWLLYPEEGLKVLIFTIYIKTHFRQGSSQPNSLKLDLKVVH